PARSVVPAAAVRARVHGDQLPADAGNAGRLLAARHGVCPVPEDQPPSGRDSGQKILVDAATAAAYRPVEIEHRYGARVHILADPLALTLLARLCQKGVVQPEVTRLTEHLYRS